jgi:hypothetical protein
MHFFVKNPQLFNILTKINQFTRIAAPIILHITVTALSQINIFPFQDHLHLLKRMTNSGKIFYQTSFFPLGPALEVPKLTENSQ